MILKISWRNVWRQKTRSIVVITAIALGVWAGVFILGFYRGMIDQRIRDVIQTEVSHIQIHHPKFKDNYQPGLQIDQSEKIMQDLQRTPEVKEVAGRSISMVMIASANASTGVKLIGIDPEREREITVIHERLLEGDYNFTRDNSILVSQELVEKLNLKLNSKTVVTMQMKNNDMIADVFKVSGIYKTSNAQYDEATAFVRYDKLQELLKVDDYHEIALLLENNDFVDSFTSQTSKRYPGLLVENWMELSPGMRYMVEASDESLGIIIWIILLALVFGVVNTMLMAILERVRELGMLMAIGMNKVRLFFMIVSETTMLVMAGAPIGLLFGFLFVTYFGNAGIDLSIISEGLEEFGYSAIVYPHLEPAAYFKISLQLIALAIISSIFPAWRTLRLKPLEAIRKI